MTFDEILSPVSRQAFLSEYWNKRFLHAKGADGRFASLINWDALAGLLELQRLSPPLLKLAQGGKAVDPERYLSNGWGNVPRIDSGRLVACLAQGATLILDCVEELHPPVRSLSMTFREALHARNYVNLYAGWMSENGSDVHWDSQDIMVLQVSGRKRWVIFEPTRLHPLQGDTEVPARPTSAPVWDGVLEDGDVLYIPRGWWHVAFPLNEPSLHLTVGTTPPNGLDMLNWVALQLRDHEEIRADLPFPTDEAGQRDRIDRIRKLVIDKLDDARIGKFWEMWEAETRAGAHIRLPAAPYEQLSAIEMDSMVRLASSHRLSFVQNGAKWEFRAFGKLYVIPAFLAPPLQRLTDDGALSVATLASGLTGADVDGLRTALSVLAKAGIVLIERPR